MTTLARAAVGSLAAGIVLGATLMGLTPAAAQRISTSSSGLGTTWTDRSAQFSGNNWSGVTYGKGTFVAVSASGSTGAGDRIMRSIDGVTWTRSSLAGAQGGSVAYGDDTFVSVAPNGRIYASPDGIQWTLWDFGVGSSNGWQGVSYVDGKFLAVAYSGPYPSAQSTNGVNWTFAGLPYLTPVTGGWKSVAFGDDTFVAVEIYNNHSSRVAYTTDSSWTIVAAPKTANWNSVTYGAGLFVAVSDDSVMTSPDGRSWTLRTAAEKNNWTSVAYAAGMFVAVSSSGTNRVMTSTDGIAWTAQIAPQRGWRSVTYGNGGFVAVGDGGAVMTSGISTGVSPALDTAVRTADGFTVNVTNYDPAYTWTPTVGAGSVTSGAASGGTLPLTVTGLGSEGGTTLTVTTARTGFSSGSATATRPAVAPPGAPTITAVTPGNGQASVAFDPPVNDGGSPLIRVEFALDDTVTVDDSTTGASPYVLSGLVNGTSSVVYARAVNVAGPGAWSAPSAPFTPQGPAPSPPPSPPPAISPSAQVLSGTVGVPVTPTSMFTLENFTLAPSYGIYPPLPEGLSLDPATGVVSGTPTVAYTSTRHWITASAGGNSESAYSTLQLSVGPAPTPAPTPEMAVIESGRDNSDRRRVFVSLTTQGIAPGSQVQPWVIRADSRQATVGKPVIVNSDGTVTWSRRARVDLKVWFTHGDGSSVQVDLPGR